MFGFVVSALIPSSIRAQEILTPTPEGHSSLKDASGFEMVYIPAGKFEMGISRDNFLNVCTTVLKAGDTNRCINLADVTQKETDIFQVHTVEVSAFWMDKYEVTIEKYAICMQPGPTRYCLKIVNASGPKLDDNPQKPQVGVDWYDAMYFCNTRRARLATEAEWEYAAKGPQNNNFPWGNTFIEANVAPSTGTYPVGSVLANKSWSGIYDLSGNAAEWVEDRLVEYVPNDKWMGADDVMHVIRGGSWANRTIQLTTFDREFVEPSSSDYTIGFRCVRSSDPLGD